jgi:uncharacterized protein YbcI
MSGSHGNREARLGGGDLVATISSAVLSILREHYGRALSTTKTYVYSDIVVVVVRNRGATPRADDGGQRRTPPSHLGDPRVATPPGPRLAITIETLTGREVVRFLSQADLAANTHSEVFFLDAPIEIAGTVEILETEGADHNRVALEITEPERFGAGEITDSA